MTTTPTPVDPPRLHQNPAFTWGMIAPAGPTLYVGGQNGTDETGAVLDGLGPQTEQALRNVLAVLEEAPRRYPSTIGGAFYLSILAVAGTALFITYRHDWRLGIQILGGSCLAAALIRLVLANRDAGMLAVRNRFIDVSLLTGMGIVLIVLATTLPDMPV